MKKFFRIYADAPSYLGKTQLPTQNINTQDEHPLER